MKKIYIQPEVTETNVSLATVTDPSTPVYGSVNERDDDEGWEEI